VVELNGFTFKEMDDPETYTMDLCEAMQFYPETDYLTGPYLLFDYKPEVIAMVTDLLVPDKVNIMWSSRQFKGQCQLTEKWFGTPHSIEEIPLEWKEAWKNPEVPPYLHLPQPNPFIATEFNIKTPTAGVPKYPEVLSEDERCRLWFRQDATFKLPRACVHVILENPLHKISPKNAVLMDMFLELLQLNMTHVVYNANMALLQYSASVENRGIAITVGGLNEKLPIFFKSIVDSFASFSTTQENFDMVKEGLHRSYRNSLLDPGDLCRSVRVKVLAFTYWSASQKDDVVDGLTIDDLNALITQFKARLFAEVLVQGNMAPEEAKDLTTYLCSGVNFDPLPPAQKFKPCAMRLPAATEVCVDVLNRDPESPNTVITDYYQCCPRNVKDETIAYFVSHCMAEPAFDELRTKKQLGYEVYPEPHNTHEMTGLSLTVVTQSSKHSVQWVTECMQNFISGFLDTFQAWSAEEFHSHVDSLVQDRLEPDLSLEAEVERNWEQIQGGHYHFDRLLKEVGVLRKLSHHEVGSWLHRYTHVGDHYKRLRVQVLTQSLTTTDDCCDTDEKECDGALVTRVLLKECDIERFKDTLTTYSYSS
jgi:nardilysin